MVFVDKKVIAFALVAVAAILVIGVLVMLPKIEELKPVRKSAPLVNVSDYSYKVSVEKPELFFQELGDAKEVGEKTSTELTVYNQNLALVKEVREMFLESGVNLVEYKDIASQIDATSVLFRDLSFEDTIVLEQNYEFDIVSEAKMLEKYIDKEITVEVIEGDSTATFTGKLLNASDGLLLETGEGIVALSNISRISFPELPEGLITKPTLVWKIWTESTGKRNTQTVYLTSGMNWRADYVAKVNEEETAMDFSGWTTITNSSGTSYPNTKLKLVAGDIHLVSPVQPYPDRYYDYAEALAGAVPKAFTEEALFEYHLYTLDRTTDIKDNETKQISLLASENVPVQKEFVFDGAAQGNKVQVKLKFKNSEEQALGVPLPKGIVRVYKEDSSGQLQFLGEDSIDHTKTEDEVRLFVGNAFDVSGERIQTESVNVRKGVYLDSYEITLENQKDTEIEVVVVERIGPYATVTSNSDAFEKKSATEIEFTVKVPAKGEKTVSYTVETRYFF